MLFPHLELSLVMYIPTLLSFIILSMVPISLCCHTCAYYLGLVEMSCVPSLSVAHQLVSLEKGYSFTLWKIFGFCTFLSLLVPWIFRCFLLKITMIISYNGLFWLVQLRGMVSITIFFSSSELVGYHPCIFQTYFPLLVNIVHLGDIVCLWIT